MESRHIRLRRKRTTELTQPYAARLSLSAGWREVAALAAGFLVMLITAWLIWAALAEAALALAHAEGARA